MYGVVRGSKNKLEILGCGMISSRYGMHSAAGAVLLALSFWISRISAYTYAVKRTTFGCFFKLHRSRTHAMDCVEARKAEHETTLAFSVDFLFGLQQLNYTSSPSQGFVGSFAGPLYTAGTTAPSCSVLISPGQGTEVNAHQDALQQRTL